MKSLSPFDRWFNRPKVDSASRDRLRSEIMRRLEDIGQAHKGLMISINEIDCGDPACPGTETVVLIMSPGARTRAVKITKPAADIVPADLDNLVLAP